MNNSVLCECVNSIEDSGLGESSRNESNPSALFTPTTTLVTSRKRKIDLQAITSFTIKMTPSVDSAESSPWINNPQILSSTMNDSISAGVEKCTLDNFATNFYMERSEFDNTTDPSSFKNMKQPSTPEKRSNKRYYSSMSTPRVSPMCKLGSPERNEILYSRLPNLSKSFNCKRTSPAKKCLFTPWSSRKDPVKFFCKERNVQCVMENIFEMLCDNTLYTCSKVSKEWRNEIMTNDKLKPRLQLFINQKIMNKENIYDSPVFNAGIHNWCGQMKQSTPIDLSVPINKILEAANSLTEGQHLEKCISCNKPDAVVKDNISQCRSLHCGMIRCVKCNSISTTGPENFIDKCQQSILDYKKPSPKYALLSSPKRYQNENGVPTFFLDDSLNTSQTLNSSGYITDPDVSHNSRRSSTSFNKERLSVSQVFKINNMNMIAKPERIWESRIPALPVIASNREVVEVVEPSSPPKVKHVACSKKSKKMLKRLNW